MAELRMKIVNPLDYDAGLRPQNEKGVEAYLTLVYVALSQLE